MDFNDVQQKKVSSKSVTFGLFAKRFSGMEVTEVFPNVPVKWVTFGQFAKSFSGMDVNAEQPQNI